MNSSGTKRVSVRLTSISPQMGCWHMCMKECECDTAVQGGTRTYQITVTPPPCANTHSHKAIQAWHPRSPCKLVFTAKKTTARNRTGRSAVCSQSKSKWTWDIWPNCLSLGHWWHRCEVFFMWRDSIIHSSQHQKRGVWMSAVAGDERVHLNTNALWVSNYSNVSSYWSKHTEWRRAGWNHFRQAWREIFPFFQLYIRIWTVTLASVYRAPCHERCAL